MDKYKKFELKVGVVTFGAIILFILGLTLARGINITQSGYQIKIRFPSVSGMQEGAPVFVNGVRRGVVKSILNDKGSVLVTATLDNISDIYSDAYALINILEIAGGKKIDIYPGSSAQKFNVNNEMYGLKPADLGDMIYLVANIGDDAKHLIKQIDTISNSVAKLFNQNNIQKLESLIDNTNSLMSNLNYVINNNAEKVNSIVSDLKMILADLRCAIDKYEPTAEEITKKIDGILNSTDKVVNNADSTLESLKNTVHKIDDMISNIEKNKSLAQKILFDKEFSERVDSLVNSLQLLVEKIYLHGINTNVRLGTRP